MVQSIWYYFDFFILFRNKRSNPEICIRLSVRLASQRFTIFWSVQASKRSSFTIFHTSKEKSWRKSRADSSDKSLGTDRDGQFGVMNVDTQRAYIFGAVHRFFFVITVKRGFLLPNERSGVERSKNDHDRDAERDDFSCLLRHHPRSNFDEMNKHRVQTPRVFREWRTRGSWASCSRNRLRN